MMAKLAFASFPKLDDMVRCRWAPVFVKPSPGSPERLVVAVVAFGRDGFHIETANQMTRLDCLYGAAAETVRYFASSALKQLEQQLATGATEVVREGQFLYANIQIGAISEGEAHSVKAVAETWMRALSSLHGDEVVRDLVSHAPRSLVAAEGVPVQIFEGVFSKDPRLGQYFSEQIRLGKQRRRGDMVTGVNLDFSAPRLVANFDGLIMASRAHSIDRIKRKMFDLLVARDEAANDDSKVFEMIVHAPLMAAASPSKRQKNALDEAIGELTDQTKREAITFVALGGMNEIVDRVAQKAA